MLEFAFEKNNLLCKNREKNNLSRGKIPAPPWISYGPSLSYLKGYDSMSKGLQVKRSPVERSPVKRSTTDVRDKSIKL